MMQYHLIRFFVSATLFLAVCFGASWILNPQSFVNFVGPSAAVFSGLLLIWGITPLLSVLVVSPLVALGLNYFFNFDVDLASMVIALLAICLQGFWTKQLVFRFIRYKKWLNSRKHLFFFLLRIGPLSSLVSASAVLILAMLDNQVLNGSFLYTFLSTWSVSMLVSVFFIPLLLLVKNAEKLKLSKRILVGFTSVLGGLATLLILKTSQYEQQQNRHEMFEQSSIEIERLIDAELAGVVNKIDSLSALFKASDNVSASEFALFSKSIFKEGSSVRALEWAPIVSSAQREEFERNASTELQQNFQIKERLATGSIVSSQQRSHYAPLHYIYPKQGNQRALGLDVYSNPQHILSMNKVIASHEIIASAPITLVQDQLAKPGMLFSVAIFTPQQSASVSDIKKKKKLSLRQEGNLLGFVVAVVQFDDFFQRVAKQKERQVSFLIEDVSSNKPVTLFGQALSSTNRHIETINMKLFSRDWKMTVIETDSWFSQSKSWQAWAVLIGGTLGYLLFQILILMMAAYSSELGQQVEVKTRALILAKEGSEQKSLAKSQFLQTLNKELRMPLLAIKAFVEQLKQKGINNKEVTGISHAGNNVALLLDTMMDLSNIESGKIKAKEDCFDFYGFLQRTESVLKASNAYEGKSIFFLIDDSVPHYINSDELYIQKLLNTLIESAHYLLKADALRLSIKLHQHKQTDASLFFTLSSQSAAIETSNGATLNQQEHDESATNSTSLAMAIKYSQLLQGDTSLGALSSGVGVLNSSIRVTISSIEQQEAQQGLTFDLMS
jgi:CHASE1-domain containing sensor protein